jgi:hypothetical protein
VLVSYVYLAEVREASRYSSTVRVTRHR